MKRDRIADPHDRIHRDSEVQRVVFEVLVQRDSHGRLPHGKLHRKVVPLVDQQLGEHEGLHVAAKLHRNVRLAASVLVQHPELFCDHRPEGAVLLVNEGEHLRKVGARKGRPPRLVVVEADDGSVVQAERHCDFLPFRREPVEHVVMSFRLHAAPFVKRTGRAVVALPVEVARCLRHSFVLGSFVLELQGSMSLKSSSAGSSPRSSCSIMSVTRGSSSSSQVIEYCTRTCSPQAPHFPTAIPSPESAWIARVEMGWRHSMA